MRFRLTISSILALVLLVQTGCQRINHEETVTLQPGETKIRTISAPTSEQKVEVTLTSTDADISASLIAHAPGEAEQANNIDVLAEKKGAKELSLAGTVPAGKEFSVVVGGSSKRTEVKIVIKGK